MWVVAVADLRAQPSDFQLRIVWGESCEGRGGRVPGIYCRRKKWYTRAVLVDCELVWRSEDVEISVIPCLLGGT